MRDSRPAASQLIYNNAALADQLKAQGIPMSNSSVFQVQDGRTVVLVGNEQQQATERRRNFLYIGAAAAALAGLAIFAICSRVEPNAPVDDSSEVARKGPSTADNPTNFEDLLGSAERLVDEGKFSAAQRMLDAYEEDFKRDPPLMVRASELSVRLETSRMLASGSSFEKNGDKVSALKIYRNVLATDADNPDAMDRIRALVGDTAFALVTFTVDDVTATVSVDGADIGQTPVTYPLAVGKHQLIIKADGYKNYTTTYAVTAGKDENLKIPLEERAAAVSTNTPSNRPSGGTKRPNPVEQPPKSKPKPKPDDDDVLMSIPSKRGK